MQRKTYIIVSLSLAVLFVWFQVIMLNLVWDRNWVKNVSDEGPLMAPQFESSLLHQEYFAVYEEPSTAAPQNAETKYYLIAPEKSDIYKTVALTLKLIRQPYESFSSLDYLPPVAPESLTGLIICTGDTDGIGNIDRIFDYLEQKKEAVFAARLDMSAGNYELLCERLDIVESFGEVNQEGIDFLDDVLLSGLFIDAKVDTVINEVNVGGRSRLYAVGHDDDLPASEHLPVIWRTLYNGGTIYVINSDMLEDFGHMGVLIGVLSQGKDAFIYPIVNSSAYIVSALPYYSTENAANLLKAYSRDIIQLQRDVFWSDLISVSKAMGFDYTFFPYSGEGRDQVEPKLMEYYGKEVSYNDAEIGAYDSKVFQETFPNYVFVSELNFHLDQSQAKVVTQNDAFGYVDSDTVMMPVTTQGVTLTKSQVFQSASLASGLGYTAHLTDFTDIFADESGVDQWTKVKRKYGDSLFEVLHRTKFLEKDTTAEAAAKMKIYLSSNPKIDVFDDRVTISGQDIGETCFILRTVNDITGYENCELTELRFRTYMVKIRDKTAVIYMEEPK